MKFKIAIVFVCFGLLTRAVCYGQYVSAKRAQVETANHISTVIRENRASAVAAISAKIKESCDAGLSSATISVHRWPGIDRQFTDSQIRKLRRLRYKVRVIADSDDEMLLDISWNE